MTPLGGITVLRRERVRPQTPPREEQTLLLSLLDATTANFALTNAIWLFERPTGMGLQAVPGHLRQTLSATLDAYPQWCGRLEAVTAVTPDQLPAAAKGFPAHGQRYGRVYVRYGGGRGEEAAGGGGGVDFVTATSSLTLDALHARTRPMTQPLWDRSDDGLARFANDCAIGQALQESKDGDGSEKDDALHPLVGIQCTTLACGGVVLAAKVAHPLADISGLVHFVRDWARVSRAVVAGGRDGDVAAVAAAAAVVPRPVFAPDRLDAVAAGDINGAAADVAVVQQAKALPMHRYDWWAAPGKPPAALAHDAAAALTPAGVPMPWDEWDTKAPVAGYTIHLTCAQVEFLWRQASAGGDRSNSRISKHDAVLAHVFSCVMRARQLADDDGHVHCDLVLGLRAGLQLGDAFMGSPILMLDVALPGTAVCGPGSLALIARRVRDTLAVVGQRGNVAAHLHALAYEASPQRLWQAFLGRRHILVTTWARAGLYAHDAVDFGLGMGVRYADGLVPRLDGIVLIKEAPPAEGGGGGFVEASRPSWIADGVDVTVNLRAEDMERLLADALLLPKV